MTPETGLFLTKRASHWEAEAVPRIDLFAGDLRAFLSRTYDLKTVADYEIGPDAQVLPEQAHAALEQAGRFVA